jgi:hypothetical protein
MQAVSPRPHTPSFSPPSAPVAIPPASPTDLHVANALRHKHLYGYTQGSFDSSLASGDTESTCSAAEYNTFVFETGSEIVVDERDGSSISEDDTASPSPGSLSTSASLFPLSTVSSVAFVQPTESSSSKAMIENVEESEDWEDLALTPRMAPFDSDAELVDPITDNFSLGDMGCPPVLSRRKAPIAPSDSRAKVGRPLEDRTATPTRRHLRPSLRPTSTQSHRTRALADLDDEFRCSTCHHAGVCADLVMKDPNFRCGDTISSNASSSGTTAEVDIEDGAGGKTPWTRQNLQGMNFGGKQGQGEEKGKMGLRVLDGGIDYVHYDIQDESDDPGGGRLLDLEDIGRALGASSFREHDVDKLSPNGNTAAGDSPSFSLRQSDAPRPPRPTRQSWTAGQVEHNASSSATSYNSASDGTSSSPSILSICAKTVVHLAPALPAADPKSDTSTSHDLHGKRDDSPQPRVSAKSRDGSDSRPRENPIWKLHKLTTGLFGSSPSGREDDGRYDYDDELYGVDVVSRGRNRLR